MSDELAYAVPLSTKAIDGVGVLEHHGIMYAAVRPIHPDEAPQVKRMHIIRSVTTTHDNRENVTVYGLPESVDTSEIFNNTFDTINITLMRGHYVVGMTSSIVIQKLKRLHEQMTRVIDMRIGMMRHKISKLERDIKQLEDAKDTKQFRDLARIIDQRVGA